ncbi:MAG TPA: SHOCT domain-containing protein [Syntrophobacteria bacterium]|nr:SHOCT domain-containing protein [Syntrophobacteria bacterium]
MIANLAAQMILPLEKIAVPLAQRGEPAPWGPGMMGNWSSYGVVGWFGSFIMLAFWALLVLVLILLARRLWSYGGAKEKPHTDESPLDILKRRYAQGEIEREEFEQKKRDLTAP